MVQFGKRDRNLTFMNQFKPYDQERYPHSRRAGGDPGGRHSSQQVVKSLARLAAEEAFSQPPTSDPVVPEERQYTGWRGDEPTMRPDVSPSNLQAEGARPPRVFRVTTREATAEPVLVVPPTEVVVRARRAETRPGPVSVVYARAVTAEVERAEVVTVLAPVVDAPVPPQAGLEFDSASYGLVCAKLAELEAVIADINFARAFRFDIPDV